VFCNRKQHGLLVILLPLWGRHEGMKSISTFIFVMLKLFQHLLKLMIYKTGGTGMYRLSDRRGFLTPYGFIFVLMMLLQ
jgi:hypothetical protein